jgi:hypothetical protein
MNDRQVEALADELNTKLPVFHGRERELIVRVIEALSSRTPSAPDVAMREALENLWHWAKINGADETEWADVKAALSASEAKAGNTIPSVENCGKYLAECNDGRLLYLNHANEWHECPNYLKAPTPPQVDREAVAREEAYSEAIRRYPDSISALVFFTRAIGMFRGQPTPKIMEWAKSVSETLNESPEITLLRQVKNSRATDYVEAAFPGWNAKAHALLAPTASAKEGE